MKRIKTLIGAALLGACAAASAADLRGPITIIRRSARRRHWTRSRA